MPVARPVRATAALLVAGLASLGLVACGGEPSDEPTTSGTGAVVPGATTESTTATTSSDASPTPSDGPTTVEPPSDPPTTTTTTTTPADDAVVVEIEIEGTAIEGPGRVQAAVGDTVRIEVESDLVDEVHVHGVNLYFDIGGGDEAVFEFVVPADPGPGLYEVETHDTGLLLFQLEIR